MFISSRADGHLAQLDAEARAALREQIDRARRRTLITHRLCSACGELVHRADFPGATGNTCARCLDQDGEQ
jgi:hypothetical protein